MGDNRSIAIPVLATKLYIPPPPSKVVVRTRLIEQLTKGISAGHKLTLISAPAGFGKTTLVSEWIARYDGQVAWLSLDESDSDPARFLTYLVAALQPVAPNIGEEVMNTLQASQTLQIESLLILMLNEIITASNKAILVLDDYHMIDAREIDDALNFFIEHLPPQLHVVITTREDPALPLARLRARGQLTELRVADLRFTPSEAAEFLNQVMSLDLSTEDVAALETRTEGWIAGLQLAALSMRGHQDVSGFIQSFAGDNRYIVEYLVEEVLQRQPDSVRSFLLQTSILVRLNGPLCDVVTGQLGGEARLEALQRGNFFLIPRDDKRHWYRYHHLFADVLRMHLMSEQPDQVLILHRRASEWYEQNSLTAEAIHHALAAKNFERAADLIERAVPAMRQSRQEATLLDWLQTLPDEVFRLRPVLSAHYAGTLLQSGQLEGVESRLQDAERWLDPPAETYEQPIFVDDEDFRRLPGSVAMYHAGIALAQGDVANTMKQAHKVLELAREDDDFLRGAALSLLGLASWTSGDLEAAYRMYADGMAHLQRIGFISDVIGGSVTLADIRITQGRLREAMNTYESGLQLATKPGVPVLRGAADMHVGMSEIYRERNDLHAATQQLLKSKELGELNGLPKNPYRWRVAMAGIQKAQGNFEGALQLLDEADHCYISDFSPNFRPIPAMRARVWVKQGKLEKALDWAYERKLSVKQDLGFLREFEHITLARILLAQYKSDRSDSSIREAIGLLERLSNAAVDGKRTGSTIEILVLQALAHQALEDIPATIQPLGKALSLAEPEGYVRIFLDEGVDMEQLLCEACKHGITSEYTGKLLWAFKDENQRSEGISPIPASQVLIDPLSQRELEILCLLQTELSVPEIARELVIAASTVRSHTKSIYGKLGVNNRRVAVNRATELNLI